MPDGGRDALSRPQGSGDHSGAIVFQVKYVEHPEYLEDPTEWVGKTLDGELEKIEALIERGSADRYVLITNVPASSHLDSGSHDKVQAVLDQKLSIPAQCWWRADLDRRLENRWDLKWSYPDLMRGTDLIRALVEGRISGDSERRARSIRVYIADQYKRDQDVRFKQVDLQNSLLNVFVDVLAVERRDPNSKPTFLRSRIRQLEGATTGVRIGYPAHRGYGAGSLLLDSEVQEASPYVVVEGAPGQGKSTLAQYICQVHRIRLLGQDADLARLPEEHKTGPLRIPFKVDLRELAQWLSGSSPFAASEPVSRDQRTLEGFLATTVRHQSGGTGFSVEDLHAVLAAGPALFVLDGLDEVADLDERTALVNEVTRAAARLESIAESLQIVVTTRPASFTSAARLPTPPFEYIRLIDLSPPLIGQYRDQWIRARGLDKSERDELVTILEEKLRQSHFSDLARNPMQLAILLSLIHRKGPALPDKRTDLYRSYMELFLDREAAKSSAVRDHRSLLLLLHGYLAWHLHVQAEQSTRTAGRISAEELASVSQTFLASRGQPTDLFADLFGGVFDRFGALVLRSDETFEFEVQPLREYFAASYLYETAPYSPAGREATGTLPERLAAMVRRPFWLNVARFYAGFYSVGELASLASGLNELATDSAFAPTALPRTVTAQLLQDWSFTQDRNAMASALGILTTGLGPRHAALGEDAFADFHVDRYFVLPRQCGASELTDSLIDALRRDDLPMSRISHLARAVRANCPTEEIARRWLDVGDLLEAPSLPRWFSVGGSLQVLDLVSTEDIERLRERSSDNEALAKALLASSGWKSLDALPSLGRQAVDVILNESIWAPTSMHPLSSLSALTRWDQRAMTAETRKFWSDLEWHSPAASSAAQYDDVLGLATDLDELFRSDKVGWIRRVDPWDQVLERSRAAFGDRAAFDRLAAIASGVRDTTNRGAGHRDLFDDSTSLMKRVRFARHKANDPSWWQSVLEQATEPRQRSLALCLLATWGTAQSLAGSHEIMSERLQELTPVEYAWVYSTTRSTQLFFDVSGSRSKRLRGHWKSMSPTPRLFTLLAERGVPTENAAVYASADFPLNQSDGQVVDEFLDYELARVTGDPSSWSRALSLFRQSGDHDVGRMLRWMRRRSNQRSAMPMPVADSILADPGLYPLGVVASAEAQKLAVAIKRQPTVGTTADQNRWFAG